MASELVTALFKRRSSVEAAGETWESEPSESSADASHLATLTFGAPPASDWLAELEPTPEEDLLSEALADGLAERGQAGPSHAPLPITAEDAAHLRELAGALADMKRRFAAEREDLKEAREEMERRAAELRAREEGLETERERQRLLEEARRDYPQPAWLENVEGKINIGVVGNAGTGKSLLINKLRRLRPHADGWAPVGIKETTAHPTMYPFPGEPRVRLWDLPGSGTAAVPSETYIQDMGLRYFDRVIIVTAVRFTSTEVALKTELVQHKVPHVMVRTKVDLDIWNNRQDNGLDPQTTLAQITEDLQLNGIEGVYLVSSRDPELFDMPKLMGDMFPGVRRLLDPSAPSFCPSAPAWNEPWAMPPTLSAVLAGLQGRWWDSFGAVYLIHGCNAHVTLHQQGQAAVVGLTESKDCVWWCNRWYVNEEGMLLGRKWSELRWYPVDPADRPLVWWWAD